MAPLGYCKTLILGLLLAIAAGLTAQTPQRYTPADIKHKIEKLNVLASVLYVAAHPDDENTYVISYLANEGKARTAYLSLTRGGGGQNLIGTEMKELLGVLRTQELLAARRLDGGEQMFSRASDFGFSKTSEETLEIWDREAVLADVVWAIRKFRPDVVINRFHHDSSGKTHGHHSASAELSYEAFDLAGDPSVYPDQLGTVDAWQPERLFFNTSYWFYGRDRSKFDAIDKTGWAQLDVGVYYPHKGMSNNELAAHSRSQHVCQGMGRTPRRGSDIEYLEPLKGSKPKDSTNLFDGINTTWSRLDGGADIGKAIDKLLTAYDYSNPAASLPALMAVYEQIKAIEDDHWRSIKLAEIEEIITASAGLFAEAVPARQRLMAGEEVGVRVEVINRSTADISLDRVAISGLERDTILEYPLTNNEGITLDLTVKISAETATSDPYWLRDDGTLGMYDVADQDLVGMPETPRQLAATYAMTIAGKPFSMTRPLIYKSTDRERGEVYKPVEVTIPVGIKISEPVYVFPSELPRRVEVTVKTVADSIRGMLRLPSPEGWTIEPSTITVDIPKAGGEQVYVFDIMPPSGAAEATLRPVIEVDGTTFDKELITIAYNHIPEQLVLQTATCKLVKLDIKTRGKRIGYVVGAGDKIPASLEQIGYQVDMIEVGDITADKLVQYDAVVLGIRAYNKHDDIKFKQDALWQYAESGGTLITQYTATWGRKVDALFPLDFELSRDRVTVEEAEVRILAPDHPVMSSPNVITDKDFDGWVQERGLYFARSWDEQFKPLLSSNDPGEPARDGGLLVAKYGQGYLIYTGYSWFRQLPAGVPGAYRIFANMLSLTPINAKP